MIQILSKDYGSLFVTLPACNMPLFQYTKTLIPCSRKFSLHNETTNSINPALSSKLSSQIRCETVWAEGVWEQNTEGCATTLEGESKGLRKKYIKLLDDLYSWPNK